MQTQLLARLRQHDIADAGQCARLEALEQNALPWWLHSLQALGAWMAAFWIHFTFTLLGVLGRFHWLFALALIGVALWLFVRRASSVFATHLALGLSLGGQWVLAWSLNKNERSWELLLPNLLLALALLLPRTTLLHRMMCLLVACFCLEVELLRVFAPVRPLVITLWLTLALVLWLKREHWALWPRQGGRMYALAHAVSLWGLGALLAYHIDLAFQWGLFTTKGGGDAARQYAHHQMAALLVWLGCAFWLLRPVPRPQQHVLLAAAATLGLLAYNAPALLLSLALMLATFRACQRAWVFVSLAALWGFFGLFYWQMQHSLLVKSLSLAALGAGLLTLRALLKMQDAGEPS